MTFGFADALKKAHSDCSMIRFGCQHVRIGDRLAHPARYFVRAPDGMNLAGTENKGFFCEKTN